MKIFFYGNSMGVGSNLEVEESTCKSIGIRLEIGARDIMGDMSSGEA